MKIQISSTGKVHGYGSDLFKWVSRLTPEERAAVRAGKVVAVRADRPSHPSSPNRTFWRVVVCRAGRFSSRVPSTEIISALRKLRPEQP